MKTNNLALFFAATMRTLLSGSIKTLEPNGNRIPKRRARGYFVNGQRVFYRPAAPFLRNVKGMRYVRDQSKAGLVSKLVAR